MTGAAWQEGNDRYLAASLRWLRLRLERLAAERPAPPAPAPPPRGGGFWLFSSPPSASHGGGEAETSRRHRVERELAEATCARTETAGIEPPPALLHLQALFGLSDFERDTLLLAAAPEFDPAMPLLCAAAQGAPAQPCPSFALALLALEEPGWDAVAAHRPLRHARLVEVAQSPGAALTASPLRAEERTVNYIKGLNVLDSRLAPLLLAVPAGAARDLAASQRAATEAAIAQLRAAAARDRLPPIQLIGSDAASRLLVARESAVALGRTLYRIDPASLPRVPAEIEQLARLWRRESLLLPVALYVDADEAEAAPAVALLLAREPGLLFVGYAEAPAGGAGAFAVEVARPTPVEQRDAWEAALGDGQAARSLAGHFDLNLAEIAEVAAVAGSQGKPAAWALCRVRLRARLEQLAQRLTPRLVWEDLVLPEEQTGQMQAIIAQARERFHVHEDWGFARRMSRGLGISVLFAGESGTGKTLAAEVLAAALELDLYRIDLSAVVSKYIGETEKNLRRMFEAAEQSGAILFFDEADALFGKRSEVKDSHDRYANIEINYLLQRMEGFSGVAILATNMKSALDTAFLRRLRFVVNFPFPGAKERRRIWERALPEQTPREGLDYERLARLNLSGGNIHSIALNGAFLAAAKGTPVTMPLMLAAARMEMRKLDRAVNEADFR